MKKKIVLIAALFAALAVLFAACDTGGTGVGVGNSASLKATGTKVKAVQLVPTATWSGIDLLDSTFKWAEGDKIEATVRVISFTHNGGDNPAQFVIQDKVGAWGSPFNKEIKKGDDLVVSWTLNSTNLGNIAAGSPKGLRIQANNCTANSVKFNFTQLKVTRDKEVLLDLAALLKDLPLGVLDAGDIKAQKAGDVTLKVVEQAQ